MSDAKKEIIKKVDSREMDTKEILIMTAAEAAEKKHWKKNQLVEILDDFATIPRMGNPLPEDLSSVSAADLNATNVRINQIMDIMIYWGLAVREE